MNRVIGRCSCGQSHVSLCQSFKLLCVIPDLLFSFKHKPEIGLRLFLAGGGGGEFREKKQRCLVFQQRQQMQRMPFEKRISAPMSLKDVCLILVDNFSHNIKMKDTPVQQLVWKRTEDFFKPLIKKEGCKPRILQGPGSKMERLEMG